MNLAELGRVGGGGRAGGGLYKGGRGKVRLQWGERETAEEKTEAADIW